MSIYCRKVVRGCGLVGGVLILLLLLSPSMSFRLQSQQQSSPTSPSKSNNNQHGQNHNASRNSEAPSWPPRIPLWGFLPSKSASSSSSSSSTSSNNHPNSINSNNAAAIANSQYAKPSKRESSISHKGRLNANLNMIEPALPIDNFDEEDDLQFEDDNDNWLVNLKRSSNSGQQQQRKRNRIYDVPQIECPPAEDGMERFACPTPDKLGRYPCVDDHVLCDGFVDCPGREDEDRQACMFYKTTKAHLDVLADALLRWARGKR